MELMHREKAFISQVSKQFISKLLLLHVWSILQGCPLPSEVNNNVISTLVLAYLWA